MKQQRFFFILIFFFTCLMASAQDNRQIRVSFDYDMTPSVGYGIIVDGVFYEFTLGRYEVETIPNPKDYYSSIINLKIYDGTFYAHSYDDNRATHVTLHDYFTNSSSDPDNYFSIVPWEEGNKIEFADDNIHFNVVGYNDELFKEKEKLEYVALPESQYYTSIEPYAFYKCGNLTTVYIPEGVDSISVSAFRQCSSLTSITIPESVKYIGESAFSQCSSLNSIITPKSLKYIGNYAFKDCYCLTSIAIPEGVQNINKYLFSGCKSLNSVVLPNSIQTIEEYAFENCISLTNIRLPENLENIRFCAFLGCVNLVDVVLPIYLKSIGANAFMGCANTSIVIPERTEYIGSHAFYSTNLKSVTMKSDSVMKRIEHYDDAFANIFGKQVKEYIIGNHVKSIATSAFASCDSLSRVIIPTSVKTIGRSAFSNCKNLKNIALPNSITNIGREAFRRCSGLTSVIIPSSVTTIGDNSFQDCTNLSSVEFPLSVKSLGESVFSGCKSLTYIPIPENVDYIPYGMFSGCDGLIDIEIPKHIKLIDHRAFFECKNLNSVHFPEGMKLEKIYNPFEYCEKLSKIIVSDLKQWCSINFGYSWIKQAYHLYSDENTEIIDIVIPEGVMFIPHDCFYGCCGLKSVTFPHNLNYIWEQAFAGCTELTSLTLPDSLKIIEPDAFYGCKNIMTVTAYMQRLLSRSDFFQNIEPNSEDDLPLIIPKQCFNDIHPDAILYVPQGTKEAYIEKEWDAVFKNIVEMGGNNQIQGIDDNIAATSKCYDLNGRHLQQPQRGVNILRMSDGTIRKVLVK